MKFTESSWQSTIVRRQAALGLSDGDLADAVGYEPGVIRLLKTGAMRLPINKVPAFARALEVEQVVLLEQVLLDASPELWKVLEPLLPLGDLAPAEVNLLRHLRKLANGQPFSPVVLEGSAIVAVVTSA